MRESPGANEVEHAADAAATASAEPSAALKATLRARLLEAVGGEKAFEDTFNWRTHYPDRAARLAIDGGAEMWSEGVAAIEQAGGDEAMASEWRARFLRKWLAYQHAGARVMNWMITGPARFPVERNKKRMDTEMKRLDELLVHVRGAGDWARRRLRSAARALASEAAKASGLTFKEKPFNGGKIVLNSAIDRVQLVFDERPSPETIQHLKSRAFRWSPREGAWQRQLTRNGIWAAEAVAKALIASTPDTSTGNDRNRDEKDHTQEGRGS